MRGTFVGKNRD